MGSCTSHKRSFQSNAAYQYNDEDDEQVSSSWHQRGLQIGLPCYLESSDGHQPSLPDTSPKKQTHTSRVFTKEVKSLANTCLSQLPNNLNRTGETSLKIDAGDLPKERTESGSTTIAADDNSSSLLEPRKEFVVASKIDLELNVVKQQPENLELHVTNIPREIYDQLRRLKNTDNPETKEVAEKLLDWITQLPSWEKSKQQRVASMMGRSLDLEIFTRENSANKIGELLGFNDDLDSFSMSTASVGEGAKLGAKYETLKSPATKPTGNAHDSMLKDDHHSELYELSKQQIIKTRRESMLLSETLNKMPSLRLSLTSNRRSIIEVGTPTVGSMSSEDNAALEVIDDLDKKINKSMQKITALRRKSLNLLADGDDSDNSDDEKSKNISLLLLEKEIHRSQEQKNELLNEREKIIAELQSKLITSTSINYSAKKSKDCPTMVNMDVTELANIAVNSESPSIESNPCSSEDNSLITELN